MVNLYYKLIDYWNAVFEISEKSIFLIFVSSIGIYITVIALTRIVGKRSFSKMTSFDFAMTIAVGSIMASAIILDAISLSYGIVGLIMIFSLQSLIAHLRRYNWFSKLIDNEPTLVMDGETLLTENMKSVKVTENDVRSKLRESNVTKLSQVKAVIFETSGDLVVLHGEDCEPIDDWILKDVKLKVR